jgi:plasmid stabilization system protein ParE
MDGEYRVHRRVTQDINEAELYYQSEGSQELADRFLSELFEAFQEAANYPTKSHYDVFSCSRRVNLKTFPYHFLYANYRGYILIFVVRHNKRYPSFGLRRKR